MGELDDWVEFRRGFRQYIISGLLGLGDTAWVIFWCLVQWSAHHWVYQPLRLSGIDYYTLWVLQFLGAVSTLAVVGIKIYRDITLMILRTQRQIRQEIEKGERNEQE